MQILIFILSFFFLYFNYKIIESDIKHKKIPNKYLLYLLLLIPFYYLYLFYSIDLHIGLFFFKIFIATLISFALYYYGIWSAGDAKYLLVLNLFIPHIGIIPYIGNIALITIIYLLLYSLYFYFIKLIFNKSYRKVIFSNIHIDNKRNFKIYFIRGKKGELKRRKTLYTIIKALVIFLTIFVLLRLSRLYIVEDIKNIIDSGNGNNNEIKTFLSTYITYIISLSMFLSFFIYYFFKVIYNLLYKIFIKKIIKKFNINIENNNLGFIFLLIILFFIIIFIIYEYINNGNEIIHKLYLIFTIYLGLYLIFKILLYLYKITFQIAEYQNIHINDLKAGDIVDKQYLIRLFKHQEALIILLNYYPTIYLQKIENPIDNQTKNMLKKMYKKVNNYHKKKKTSNFQEVNYILTLKTFAFGGYILGGFIITFILQDKIFKTIFDYLYEIFRNFYN